MASVVLRQMMATSSRCCRPAEPQGGGAGVFVGGGGQLRLPAGAAVDARVPRQELAHPLGDGRQRRCRRGGIERQVPTLDAVDARHGQLVADEAGEAVVGHVKMIWPPAALS